VKRFSPLFPPAWPVLIFLTILLVYIYSFMEWIFFVTKPSFMSGMSLWHQIQIFLLAALGMGIVPLALLLLLGLADRIIQRPLANKILIAIGILIPTIIFSTLFLLLVDNFTYTVFKFGVVSTERFLRAGYGFLFLILCGVVYYRIYLYVRARSAKKHPIKRNQWIFLGGLLLVSLILSISTVLTSRSTGLATPIVSKTGNLPNIILLGSDGLDATHLSAYGYERDTTPNIKRLMSSALVAENDFPNGGTTAGSVASILTGKLPVETRVIYPPDILTGEDAYQHLPGILKRLGYHTVDLSVPYFGDALTLNMQGGFDIANERSGADNFVVKLSRLFGGVDSAYFTDAMTQRLSDRLLHIFFIKQMINPYDTVIQPAKRETEQKRYNELVSVLEDSKAPVFVHVHMLGTHGPRFEVRQQVFSAGQNQVQDWMPDFYDDSILSFDQYVGDLFDYLSNSGKLKNTVVILYSDHGHQWKVYHRVPLIFWFPNGENAGKIEENVQNVDIAPTILDYLGLSIPKWMDGKSLVGKNVAQPPYIFSASVDSNQIEVTKNGLWEVDAQRKAPPFYQLGYVGLVACDQWFELYVQNPALREGIVQDHTYPCDPSKALSAEEAKHILLDQLAKNGFDISSFPSLVPVQNDE